LERDPEQYWDEWLAIKQKKKNLCEESLSNESFNDIASTNIMADMLQAMYSSIKKFLAPVIEALSLFF
jgi:hypothetical protein